MLLTLLVFEQKGSVNGIFAITPAIAYNKDDAKELNKKKILEILRHDREENLHGKHVLDKNPSEDLSTIKFYYNPVMEKQQKYKNLPYKLTDTITVIDAFTCIGSRFRLDTLSVIVEVCQSNCGEERIWANIYYVADSETPVCVIKIIEQSLFIEECHMP